VNFGLEAQLERFAASPAHQHLELDVRLQFGLGEPFDTGAGSRRRVGAVDGAEIEPAARRRNDLKQAK
jgi:hypothetical protein